jgi:purine-binding chemotaxis protein CheW
MTEQQYTSFRLDEHQFGINILLVREIIRNVDFTPVEQAPDGIMGLLNLRGQIITVLDLSGVLGLEQRVIDEKTRFIILKTVSEMIHNPGADDLDDEVGSEPVGIIVDEIADIISVDESDIEVTPANANGINGANLHGVAKLEQQLLLILSIRKVMNNWSHKGRLGITHQQNAGV